MASPRLEVDIVALTGNLKKGLDEARSEMAKFKRDAERGTLNQRTVDLLDKEAVNLARLKTEAQRARTESAKLTLEKRKSRTETTALAGSYREAQRRLTALGKTIRETEGGFSNTTPEIRKQIEEYRSLNEQLKAFDSQMGLNYRRVGDYRGEIGSLIPSLSGFENQLRMMGTSIGDVSNQGAKGFSTIGSAVGSAGSQLLAFAGSPVGLAIAGVGGLIAGVSSAYPIIKRFDDGLTNIGKTSGLTGRELDKLGQGIVRLSRDLQVVSTERLTQYATVAGQLGIKGRDNILAFTEALAKLETASDITGEEGGADIARFLNIVDGGVKNVSDFGDEIVNLGNNFAATEKEILGNATAIAQNTGLYKLGRKDALAYATATKAVGLEAEVVGSAIFRSLAQLEKFTLESSNAEKQLSILGVTQKELGDLIKKDSAGALRLLINRLNDVQESGGSVTEVLNELSINNVRDVRVLGTLASSGYGELRRAMEEVMGSAGAMSEEFDNGASKIINQTARIKIAWENMVLSFDRGKGVIGGTVSAMAGGFADILERANELSLFLPKMFEEYRKGVFSMKRLSSEVTFLSGLTGGAAGAGAAAYMRGVNSIDIDPTALSRTKVSKELEEAKKQYEELRDAQVTMINGFADATEKERMAIRKKTAEAYANYKEAEKREKALAEVRAKNAKLMEQEAEKEEANKQALQAQAQLMSEINRLTEQITRESLSEYDRKLFDIEKKYSNIYSKITDATVLGIAKQNEEAEKLRVTITKIASELDGLKPIGITGLTGSMSSAIPDFQAWRDATAKDRQLPNKEMDKRLQNRLERVVEGGFRNGMQSILSDIEGLGSRLDEVLLNSFGRLSDALNTAISNMVATSLGNAFAKSVTSDTFQIGDISNKLSKGIVVGASMAGQVLGGLIKNEEVGGAVSGALTGVATGATLGASIGAIGGPAGMAIGGLVGLIGGLFGGRSRRKERERQEELQRQQLEEQRKQTRLMERQQMLAYSSSVIGQMTNQGVVTSVDRDEFGNLVASVRGDELQLVIDRSKSGRG